MKIRPVRSWSFRTKLALTVGSLFLVMLALAIVVQNISLDHAFDDQIAVSSTTTFDDKGDGNIEMEGTGICQEGKCDGVKFRGSSYQAPPSPSASSGSSASSSPGITTMTEGGFVDVRDSVVDWMLYSSIAVFALCGLVALILIWTLTGAMVKRLKSISQQASQLDLSRPGGRISVGNKKDEIGKMADTLNSMIERMEASNQAQQAFVRNASHELKTPITTIGTSLEALVAQGRLSQDAEPSVKRAIDANHKSAELINSLLELSRFQATHQLELHSLDLAQEVSQTLEGYKPEIEEAGLTVEAEGLTGAAVGKITADSKYLHIALDNLIRNAIVHNVPQGYIRLAVEEGENTDEAQPTVAVVITNSAAESASGIAHSQEDLTTCFYRGDSTRLSDKPGHGLGLSIVQEIATTLKAELTLTTPTPTSFQARLAFPRQ